MAWMMKSKPRDVQRHWLYAAEQEVSAYLRDIMPTIVEIQTFVDSILSCRWLQMHFTATALDPITVLGGRQRNPTALTYTSTISIPKAARSKFLVIHEVAHILCNRYYGGHLIAAHGRQFATFQLALVKHFLGENDALELHEAFARYGVAHSIQGL